MSILIVLTVVIGIVTGAAIYPSEWLFATDTIMDFGLCLLLLLVGIDIGQQKNGFSEIKKMGLSLLIVPIMIAIGTLFGSVVGGYFLGLPLNEASAVGAGLGWYSLSSVILMDYSAHTSALAFITNVLRELIAILTIPFVARFIGFMEAVAPCGATAMDTSLPIITKFTDSKTAILAFSSGAILSTSVPVLVSFFISLT
ncbi:MAG: lysine exporter LysO family protein [Vallitaleaceae bacterium]|nr:lysine exporter LysO family protein [Vallitaleaceae bacterium]